MIVAFQDHVHVMTELGPVLFVNERKPHGYLDRPQGSTEAVECALRILRSQPAVSKKAFATRRRYVALQRLADRAVRSREIDIDRVLLLHRMMASLAPAQE